MYGSVIFIFILSFKMNVYSIKTAEYFSTLPQNNDFFQAHWPKIQNFENKSFINIKFSAYVDLFLTIFHFIIILAPFLLPNEKHTFTWLYVTFVALLFLVLSLSSVVLIQTLTQVFPYIKWYLFKLIIINPFLQNRLPVNTRKYKW